MAIGLRDNVILGIVNEVDCVIVLEVESFWGFKTEEDDNAITERPVL